MKYNFYFVHGWSFEQSFWDPVKKMIKENNLSKDLISVDLHYFSKNVEKYYNFTSEKKNIFIVHSYGLNWFLKKKIRCKALINFFGSPDFINLQLNPLKATMKIDRMIETIDLKPEDVIKKFYKLCNINYEKKKIFNVKNLKKSLIDLRSENLLSQFLNSKNKVLSIYSLNDKVFCFKKEKVLKLKNENHKVKIFKNYDHGFPLNNPSVCFKIIKKFISEI